MHTLCRVCQYIQSSVCSLSCALAPSWTHLGVWNSDRERQHNYFCMAFHNLQFTAGNTCSELKIVIKQVPFHVACTYNIWCFIQYRECSFFSSMLYEVTRWDTLSHICIIQSFILMLHGLTESEAMVQGLVTMGWLISLNKCTMIASCTLHMAITATTGLE